MQGARGVAAPQPELRQPQPRGDRERRIGVAREQGRPSGFGLHVRKIGIELAAGRGDQLARVEPRVERTTLNVQSTGDVRAVAVRRNELAGGLVGFAPVRQKRTRELAFDPLHRQPRIAGEQREQRKRVVARPEQFLDFARDVLDGYKALRVRPVIRLEHSVGHLVGANKSVKDGQRDREHHRDDRRNRAGAIVHPARNRQRGRHHQARRQDREHPRRRQQRFLGRRQRGPDLPGRAARGQEQIEQDRKHAHQSGAESKRHSEGPHAGQHATHDQRHAHPRHVRENHDGGHERDRTLEAIENRDDDRDRHDRTD